MGLPTSLPDRWMFLIPSVVASALWAVFFGLHMASLILFDPSGLLMLPMVVWELCWTTMLAFVAMLPAGAVAYVLIRLWRRYLTSSCS